MRCKYVLPSGEQCKANAVKNSTHCYFHSPLISEAEKKAAQAKGGANRARKLDQPLPGIKLEKLADVKQFMSNVIGQAAKGEMDTRAAKDLIYMATEWRNTQTAYINKKGSEDICDIF